MITVILLLTLALVASQIGKISIFAIFFSLAVVIIEFIVNDPGIMPLAANAVFALIYSYVFFWLAFRVHNEIPQYAAVLFVGITGWFFLPVVMMNM